MSLDFFSGGGSKRPSRIPKNFFRGGSRGSRGSTGGKSEFGGREGPLGGLFAEFYDFSILFSLSI